MARFRFMKKARKVEGWGTATAGKLLPFGRVGEIAFVEQGQGVASDRSKEKSHHRSVIAGVKCKGLNV